MKKDFMRSTVLALLAALPLYGGCNGKEEPPAAGPAEQMGREIDKTINKTILGGVKQAQEVWEKVEEKVKQANEALKKMDSATE